MQDNFYPGTPGASATGPVKHAYVGTPCGTANAPTDALNSETLTIIRIWKEITAASVTVNTTTDYELIPNSWVGTGRALYPQRLSIAVAGTTSWTQISQIVISDNYATAVVFSTTLVAQLTSTASCLSMPGFVGAGAATNTTGSTALHRETGGTAGYGLKATITHGSITAATGSNLIISGWCFCR